MASPPLYHRSQRGKRLTYEDYVVIELLLKDGWKPNATRKEGATLCSQHRAQHHQKGDDAAVQWEGAALQGQDRLESLS